MDIYKQLIEVDYTDYDNDSGAPFWGNTGAGVLPYSVKTKRFLVAYRSAYVNEPHTYGIIGGKIDRSEGIEHAAKREFKEETGYSGNVKLKLIYTFKTTGFVYYNYLGLVPNEFSPTLDWETESIKWVTFDELLDISPKHFGVEAVLNDSRAYEILRKLK